MVKTTRLHLWTRNVAVSNSSSLNHNYGEMVMNNIDNPNDTIAGLTKKELYEIIFTAVTNAMFEANRVINTGRADQVARDLQDRASILKG